MDTNVYLQLLDSEVDDIHVTDGMSIYCHQHGYIMSYRCSDYIPWSDLEELVDEHLHSMHYA